MRPLIRVTVLSALVIWSVGCSAEPGAISPAGLESDGQASAGPSATATTTPRGSLPTVPIVREWLTPALDGGWLVGGGPSGRVHALPDGEVALDARNGRVLSIVPGYERGSTLLRTRVIETGDVLLEAAIGSPVRSGVLVGDSVVYSVSSGGDGGVWRVDGPDGEPLQVVAPNPPGQLSADPDSAAGRGLVRSSPGGEVIAADLVIDLETTFVDVIRGTTSSTRIKLPTGLNVEAVGRDRIVARDEGRLVGVDIDTGQEVWAIAFGGLFQGGYITSDGSSFVTALRIVAGPEKTYELLVIDLSSDSIREVHSWAAADAPPGFAPELSSDQYATFIPGFWDFDEFLASGSGRVEGVVVDLESGSMSSAPIEVAAEPYP